MSLLKKLLLIKDKQPVTEESLKQLELELRKAELIAKIKKAEGEKPRIMEKIFGKSTSNPFDFAPKRSDYDPFAWKK